MSNDTTDDETACQPAQPDGFAAVASLLATIADPKAYAQRLQELRGLETAIANGQAALAADRAAFAEYETKARAELGALDRKIKDREVAVFIKEEALKNSETERERNLREREAMLDAHDRASDPFYPIAGSGLTKEPETSWRDRARRNLKPVHVHGGLSREPDELEARLQRQVPYIETDQNKLPMPKAAPPRGRGRRGVRVLLG